MSENTRCIFVNAPPYVGKSVACERVAEELGADGFVTKPYANAEVVEEVRRLLGEAAD